MSSVSDMVYTIAAAQCEGTLKVCSHVTLSSLCPLLPRLKFSIVPDGPIYLPYSDDNKKNIFDNGDGQGKKLRVNRP